MASPDPSFSPPAGFAPLAAITSALSAVPRRWAVTVTMHAYLDEVRANVVLSHGHFTACGDRSTRIQGEVDDLHWVARLLAGAGLPYSIESPPELAEAVRAYAFEMVANVERDGVAQQPIEDAGLPDVRSTRL